MHIRTELTAIIYESHHQVMAFAFSQPSIQKMLDDNFKGAWAALRKTLDEWAEVKADRALRELAMTLRVLDDEKNINEFFAKNYGFTCGRLFKHNDCVEELGVRDAANKIIHARHFEWKLKENTPPIVICRAREPERWEYAEIELLALTSVIGLLGEVLEL